MTTKQRKKTAYILKAVAVVLIWEFTFPGHVVGQEIPTSYTEHQNASAAREDQPRLPISADKPREEARQVVYLNITAYSSTRDQTDGDPFTTASGSKVRDGVIAANFLPIGTRIRIPDYYGDKVFVVEDRMNPRHRYMADIWMPSREQAKEWGVRYTKLEVL